MKKPLRTKSWLTFHHFQCDNTRPFCRKCTDGGRECAGYERETVFIVGTIQDQGRCSSHPPRVVKSKKSKSPPKDAGNGFGLVPTEPLRPAWDDLISISCQGRKFRLQIAALNTSLQAISRAAVDEQSGDVGSGPVYISFPAYEPLGLQSATGEDGFDLRSECLVHLAASDADTGGDRRAATDSICLFLYQVSCTLRKLIQPLADRF